MQWKCYLPKYILIRKTWYGSTSLQMYGKRLKMESGLDLVIIDYLQLMEGDGRTENRQQEISKISRSLKNFGKGIKLSDYCVVTAFPEP